MKDIKAVLSSQITELKTNKIQMIFFAAWIVITIAFPLILNSGLGAPEYWSYPRQAAPAVGVAVAGGFIVLLFSVITANHYDKGLLKSLTPVSYILGMALFYSVIIVIMAIFGAIIGTLTGVAMLNYTMILLVSMLCAMFIGGIIGLLSRSIDRALMVGIPTGAILGGIFIKARDGVYAFSLIDQIRPFIRWFYAERINNMLIEVRSGDFMIDVAVMLINAIALAVLFILIYRVKIKQSCNYYQN